jgi:hypothetical protein
MRLTLTKVLEHPWILKGNKRAQLIRRNSSGNKLAEMLAFTHVHDEGFAE